VSRGILNFEKITIMEKWMLYAIISMFFAGLTSVLAKYGIKNVSGETGLGIRTMFVFAIIGVNVLLFSNYREWKPMTNTDLTFLFLSACTTSVSWIFYYKAIKIGNVSQVALIDKGSIVITLLLSFLILKDPITFKTLSAIFCILSGLAILLLK
jgi:bacterial/archaeal transporter family protein